MVAARLDDVLSSDQVRLLAAYLLVACNYGHGQVTIQVKNGIPRFIGLHLEETFDRNVMMSRLARFLSDNT